MLGYMHKPKWRAWKHKADVVNESAIRCYLHSAPMFDYGFHSA